MAHASQSDFEQNFEDVSIFPTLRESASAIQKNTISLHISTALIILFTSRFKTQASWEASMLRENGRFAILNARPAGAYSAVSAISAVSAVSAISAVSAVFTSNPSAKTTYPADRWEEKDQ
ncbi:hypothetical protein G7Y79_00003g011130 [Physcia stellaris]|nr:hypothetical protein G7Y79_00003g011130 [Physcia stellaris]